MNNETIQDEKSIEDKKLNLINLDLIAENLREQVKKNIEKYGENTVYWMLQMAPLKKLITEKLDENNPEISFQLAAHIIVQLASKDPMPPHYMVAREVLTKNKSGDYETQDQELVVILAIEILKHCQNLKTIILGDAIPVENDKGFSVLSLKEGQLFNIESLMCHGMLWHDHIFLDYISKLGRNGKKSTKELKPIYQNRFVESIQENTVNTKNIWNIWVNEKETFTPPYLSILGDICWKDIVKTKWEINKKTKQKSEKVRQSGHLTDQKLKYQKPKNQNQPSLFDILSPEIIQKIEESKLEIKAEGIKLTPPEHKLVNALNSILYEKSQTKDSKKEDFYSGNEPFELVAYGVPNQKAKAAVLKFKPSELYKAYMGKDDYTGQDILYINNILYHLESKKMLIKYDRVKKVKEKNGFKELTDRIEDFQPLIKILYFIPNLTNEEKENLDNKDSPVKTSRGEMIIALNPIFIDQIDTKFIELPADTNRRLVIAAGGHNKVTASMNILMEYMLREISNSRYKAEINEKNLPFLLNLETYVKQGRKKLLQERIDKDIQAIINIGIINKVEKKPNSVGGIKYIFYLNKDYD